MAIESSVIVGSGIGPLKKEVCPNAQGQRRIRGTNVVCLNPEDASAGCSGVVTQVTVGTTPVRLPTVAMASRRALSIRNNSALNTLYLGFNSTVTTANGFPLRAGESIPFDFTASIMIFGIADNAGTDVRIIEVS